MPKFNIGIIIVYFGKWPKWFHLFILSCKRNPEIDFLLFTDNDYKDYGQNIHHHSLNLSEFNRLASSKLELTIKIACSYKVCDLRPAFGHIFNDYLKKYKFWGYSDLDVFYGNFSEFIQKDAWDNYDVITSKKEYLAGHFTLYRNNELTNNLYKFSPDYQRILVDNDYLGFDECNFLWTPLLSGVLIEYTKPKIESMTHVIKRLSKAGYIKSLFQPMVSEQDGIINNQNYQAYNNMLLWKNGNLIDLATNKNVLYFHFHFLKKLENFNIPEWTSLPPKFNMSREGFFI